MDLLGADMLVNPKVVTAKHSDLPDLSDLIQALPADDPAPAPSLKPKLVPSADDVGPMKSWDGMENLNAEAFLKPVGGGESRMSEDVLMKEKYDMLRKFERLQKLGVPIRKRFTMDSPLDEMRMELDFIKKEREMDASIKQFSQWFVTGMSALEWSSKNINAVKMFGLHLDGLSESAQMNVGDLEEDFEELYELYGDSMKVHPLVKIPMRVAVMVYMVHLTNQMAQKAPIPNIQDILRQNPEIGRQLAGAAMAQQTRQFAAGPPVPTPPAPSQSGGNPLSGLMSFMSGTVNVPTVPPPAPIPVPTKTPEVRPPSAMKKTTVVQPAPRRELKGPSGGGIADILKTIQANPPPTGPANLVSTQISKQEAAGGKPAPSRKSTGRSHVVLKL
jgi:hypothetical protein